MSLSAVALMRFKRCFTFRTLLEHPFRVIKRQFGHVGVIYRAGQEHSAVAHAVCAEQTVDGKASTIAGNAGMSATEAWANAQNYPAKSEVSDNQSKQTASKVQSVSCHTQFTHRGSQRESCRASLRPALQNNSHNAFTREGVCNSRCRLALYCQNGQ